MRSRVAVEKFMARERYNCAQAILYAFRDMACVGEEEIRAARKSGYGRAEGGVCGAAHAAKRVLDPSLHAEFDRRFAERAGSVVCRRIRKQKRASCRECVRIAAELTEEIVGENRVQENP